MHQLPPISNPTSTYRNLNEYRLHYAAVFYTKANEPIKINPGLRDDVNETIKTRGYYKVKIVRSM